MLTLTVTRSFRSVTILEGESVTLSCSTSILEVGFTWSHNGADIVGGITFSPPVLNHNLTIRNALPSHSGVYTCHARAGELSADENITVNILPGIVVGVIFNSTVYIYSRHHIDEWVINLSVLF